MSALEDWPGDMSIPWTRTLVSNGGYRHFPMADVLMCTDRRWLTANQGELADGYKGSMIIVTRPDIVKVWDPRMVLLRRKYIKDASGDIFARRDTLVEGWTSTSSMIATAVLRGSRRIILIGVDLAPAPDGKRRIYDDSVERSTPQMEKRYQRQVNHLTMQADWVNRKGIEVINASRPSGLQCYPYARWDDIEWPTPG
jgi:hypothetical protein